MNHRINGLFKNICSPCVHSSWNDYGQVFLLRIWFFMLQRGPKSKGSKCSQDFLQLLWDETWRLREFVIIIKIPLSYSTKKTSRAFLCISTPSLFQDGVLPITFSCTSFFCFFWAKVSRARKKQFWVFTVKVPEQSKVRTLIFAKRLSNLWAKLFKKKEKKNQSLLFSLYKKMAPLKDPGAKSSR